MGLTADSKNISRIGHMLKASAMLAEHEPALFKL